MLRGLHQAALEVADTCCPDQSNIKQRYKQRQENHGKSTSVTSAYRASDHGCQSCRLIMANAGRCFQLAACLPRLLWMQNNGCWMHDDVNCDLRVDKGYFLGLGLSSCCYCRNVSDDTKNLNTSLRDSYAGFPCLCRKCSWDIFGVCPMRNVR